MLEHSRSFQYSLSSVIRASSVYNPENGAISLYLRRRWLYTVRYIYAGSSHGMKAISGMKFRHTEELLSTPLPLPLYVMAYGATERPSMSLRMSDWSPNESVNGFPHVYFIQITSIPIEYWHVLFTFLSFSSSLHLSANWRRWKCWKRWAGAGDRSHWCRLLETIAVKLSP